jgi:hypothetical protein
LGALRLELKALEERIGSLIEEKSDSGTRYSDVADLHVLYVGGRIRQIPQFKTLVERLGARFLYHDGGIEHSPTILPNLINRADLVLFPIDCVSHDAVAAIKRLCGQSNKRYVPLRTASLAAVVSALSTLREDADKSDPGP